MSWATPLAGLLAALLTVPPLIVLYLLKRKRRMVTVSSTLLWRKAVEDLQANAPLQKLRRNLLLLLQLIILTALLGAFAGPMLQGVADRG